MKQSVYEKITAQFIESLNNGVIPWKKPFKGNANFITKKEYRGFNALSTSSKDFECPYWVTFNQAVALKGKIKKGSKGTLIIYWSKNEKEVENEEGVIETKECPFFTCTTVFNLEQTEGIAWEYPQEIKTLTGAETVISNYKNAPEVVFEKDRAFYSPLRDLVNMPKKQRFVSTEEFYCTFFHELIHSTGHQSRLDRPELSNMAFYNSHNYSKEELTAEIGAAFLCHETGILNETMGNSEAYIAGWAKALGNDPKMIVEAAGKAKKAVGFILNTGG